VAAFDPDLPRVGSPTLTATGCWDRLTSPAIAKQAAEGLPNAQTVVFDRSAHRPWVEEPDAYFRAVGDFLAG
jgi:proline iminopeptidase